MATLADNLRLARGSSDLSQEALADAASLSLKAVNDIERGAVVRPQARTMFKLAEALGTSVAALRGDT